MAVSTQVGEVALPLQSTNWIAIYTLALAAVCFVTSELIPASLLTPVATDLNVSQGMAGLAISLTAFAAIFSSLFASTITGSADRRLVALGCTGLVFFSAIIVAVAPNFIILLIGRLLLGVAMGGFWTTISSLVLRLARIDDVPRALSLIFGSVPIAILISLPMGSFIGEIVGWRGAFYCAALLTLICFILQLSVLPSFPGTSHSNIRSVFALKRYRGVPVAMLALFFVFAGKFSIFAYIRPFLEINGQFSIERISFMLLIYGLANLIGTALSSIAIAKNLKYTLLFPPLIVAVCAIALTLAGDASWLYGVLLAFWGLMIGFIPVSWTSWVTLSLSKEAGAAGCMQIGIMQLAIAAGVLSGGLLIAPFGTSAPLLFGAGLLVIAVLIIAMGVEQRQVKCSDP